MNPKSTHDEKVSLYKTTWLLQFMKKAKIGGQSLYYVMQVEFSPRWGTKVRFQRVAAARLDEERWEMC